MVGFQNNTEKQFHKVFNLQFCNIESLLSASSHTSMRAVAATRPDAIEVRAVPTACNVETPNVAHVQII